MEIKREVSSKSHHNSVMWNLSVPTKLTSFFCLCKVLLQFTTSPYFPPTFSIFCYVLFFTLSFYLWPLFTVPLQLQFLFNLKKYTFHTVFYRINSILIVTCEKLHKRKKFKKNRGSRFQLWSPALWAQIIPTRRVSSSSCTDLPLLIKLDLNYLNSGWFLI